MKAWDFEFAALDGSALPLERFRGNVLLVVNTASKCGFTPQYEGLERLHETHRAAGLTVLGVPSNDFGGQEPGSAATIQEFCTTRFNVTFPLTAKTVVVGEAAHPFYRWVVGVKGQDAAPRWNFHKILIDRTGAVVDTYSSRVAPDAAALTDPIARALAAAL